MFYSKLPIIILAEMVSEESDSIYSRLAKYILYHMDEIQDYSIRDLSARTYISISSISRFCRDIGLKDFAELKELVSGASLNFEICSSKKAADDQKDDYISSVEEALERVRRSIDMKQLYSLAEDIRVHENIYLCGILKGETAAMNLQADLVMLGKPAITKVRYSHQAELLRSVGAGDLVIIFSYTGVFYKYGYPKNLDHKKKGRPRLWFITSDPEARKNPEFDEVIWFDSMQNQASHPYQLQMVASLIAQCYGHLLENGKGQ